MAKVIDAEPVTDLVPVAPETPTPEPQLDLSDAQVAESLEALRGQRKQGAPLTHYEQMAILDLYHKHKLTQVEIATRLNCDQSTVSRTLLKYSDTTVLAKKVIKARAVEIAEKIIDTGEAKDLIKVLQGTRMPDGERVLESTKTDKGGSEGSNPVYVGVKINLNDLKR